MLDFTGKDHAITVRSLHPGVTLAQVRAATGFALESEAAPATTAAPSAEQLAIIRRLDPHDLRAGVIKGNPRAGETPEGMPSVNRLLNQYNLIYVDVPTIEICEKMPPVGRSTLAGPRLKPVAREALGQAGRARRQRHVGRQRGRMPRHAQVGREAKPDEQEDGPRRGFSTRTGWCSALLIGRTRAERTPDETSQTPCGTRRIRARNIRDIRPSTRGNQGRGPRSCRGSRSDHIHQFREIACDRRRVRAPPRR